MVGVAAQHRGFKNRFGHGRQALLEKQADSAGQRFSAERVQILAFKVNFPGLRGQKLCQCVQQRSFACAISTEEGPAGAGLDFQFKLVDEPEPCHQDIQIAGLKKRHGDWVAEFLKIRMKDGTPISAVTTPTGSCCGASAVRARLSANTRKLPPSNTAPGMR